MDIKEKILNYIRSTYPEHVKTFEEELALVEATDARSYSLDLKAFYAFVQAAIVKFSPLYDRAILDIYETRGAVGGEAGCFCDWLQAQREFRTRKGLFTKPKHLSYDYNDAWNIIRLIVHPRMR